MAACPVLAIAYILLTIARLYRPIPPLPFSILLKFWNKMSIMYFNSLWIIQRVACILYKTARQRWKFSKTRWKVWWGRHWDRWQGAALQQKTFCMPVAISVSVFVLFRSHTRHYLAIWSKQTTWQRVSLSQFVVSCGWFLFACLLFCTGNKM